MKKSSLLFLSLMASASVFAQFKMPKSPLNDKSHAMVHYLLQRNQVKAVAKTTTKTLERVIGESDYEFAGPISFFIDSSSYSYSGTRGSEFDYNSFSYRPEFPYIYTPMLAVDNRILNPEVLFDSTVSYNTDTTGALQIEYTQGARYDGNNNLTTYYSTSSGNSEKVISSYNAQNQITGYVDLVTPAGQVQDTSLIMYYYYNAANQLIADSSAYKQPVTTWAAIEKNTYEYNTAGNIVMAHVYQYDVNNTPTEVQRYTVTYTADNQIKTASVEALDSLNNLSLNYVDTFGYTAGVNYHTYYQEYDANHDSLYTEQYHVTPSGVTDTLYTGYYDYNTAAWQKIMMLADYTAANNPQYIYLYPSIPGTGYILSGIITYYYESYTSIKNASLLANVKVYPNPAKDYINIQMPGTSYNNYTIQLVNTLGQTVLTEQKSGASAQISTSAIIPGMYWLQIKDNTGVNLYRQAIVKQ